MSFAEPKDFHWACSRCRKTLHFICAEIADVTGPVGLWVSSTGEFGGLGSLKDGGSATETERTFIDGSNVRGCGARKEPKEFVRPGRSVPWPTKPPLGGMGGKGEVRPCGPCCSYCAPRDRDDGDSRMPGGPRPP